MLQRSRARAAEPGRARNRVAEAVPGTLGQTDGVLGLKLYTGEKNSYTKHMSSSPLNRVQMRNAS